MTLLVVASIVIYGPIVIGSVLLVGVFIRMYTGRWEHKPWYDEPLYKDIVMWYVLGIGLLIFAVIFGDWWTK